MSKIKSNALMYKYNITSSFDSYFKTCLFEFKHKL